MQLRIGYGFGFVQILKYVTQLQVVKLDMEQITMFATQTLLGVH